MIFKQGVSIKEKVIKKWIYLIGNDKKFSLENRIFHSFSVLVIFFCFLYLFLNIFLSLIGPGLVILAIITFHSWVFYISRFKDRFKTAVIISAFECNIFIGVNYFLNAGIIGPSLIMFFSTLFLLTSIIPKNRIVFWLVINILVVGGIVITEFYFPSTIIDTYNDRFTHFIDTFLSYIILIVLMVLGIYYSRSSYLKQQIELRARSIELAKINEEKNKIFSIVSHDLRSPLAAVQQYLNLLANTDIDSQDKIMLESKLLNSTNDAQYLLTNLLHWSKNQMDGTRVKKEILNLHQTLSNTFNIASEFAKGKGIALIWSCDDQTKIYADADMLQLVIRNLLNNALKFTKSGGKVILEAKEDLGRCLIEIKDNGIGMSENVKNKLFSMNTTSSLGTQNEKGTGIGLMLCKEYIDLQGGEISVESKEKLGTEIKLSFPFKEHG